MRVSVQTTGDLSGLLTVVTDSCRALAGQPTYIMRVSWGSALISVDAWLVQGLRRTCCILVRQSRTAGKDACNSILDCFEALKVLLVLLPQYHINQYGPLDVHMDARCVKIIFVIALNGCWCQAKDRPQRFVCTSAILWYTAAEKWYTAAENCSMRAEMAWTVLYSLLIVIMSSKRLLFCLLISGESLHLSQDWATLESSCILADECISFADSSCLHKMFVMPEKPRLQGFW